MVVAFVELDLQDIEGQHLAIGGMVGDHREVAFGRTVLPFAVFGIPHHVLRMGIVVARKVDVRHQPHGGFKTFLLETGIAVSEIVLGRIPRGQSVGIHPGIRLNGRRIVAPVEKEVAQLEQRLPGSRPRGIAQKIGLEQLLRLFHAGLRRTPGQKPAQPFPEHFVGTGRIPSGLLELHECLAVFLHTVEPLAAREVPFQSFALCTGGHREQTTQQQCEQYSAYHHLPPFIFRQPLRRGPSPTVSPSCGRGACRRSPRP